MGSTNSPPSAKPLRLAILEADTPLPNTNAKFHGYRGVFTDLFRRAVAPDTLESRLAITGYDVVNAPSPDDDEAAGSSSSYPDLDAVDAILISGSKHSAYLDEPWILRLVAFVRRALATDGRVKIVGVCFGQQIVARALGVTVDRNVKGWELSVTEMTLSERGRQLFGKDTLKIQQMHKDIIVAHPEGAEPLAETDVCATQGFLIPGKVIAVQGHPEFTGPIVTEILTLRRETNIIDEDLYKSGMDRVHDEHDGVRIAQVFLRFMTGQL